MYGKERVSTFQSMSNKHSFASETLSNCNVAYNMYMYLYTILFNLSKISDDLHSSSPVLGSIQVVMIIKTQTVRIFQFYPINTE